MLPNLIDASTRQWVETLDAVAAMNDPGYTFVPGHGDLGNVEDIAAFRDYLTTLRTLVIDARAQGKTGDVLTQSIVPRLKEQFGRWEFAEPLAKSNVLETDAELSGTKRVPQPVSTD
jgi:glyoxylase-like metal-dependent hydrolase (beta-lactamase superfamily II)